MFAWATSYFVEPTVLAGVVGTDLFGLDEAEAKARLRRMISEALAGRAKPTAAPGFPGGGRAMPREARFPGALPQVWKVPARNPNFTGRGADLDRLARGLAAGAAVTVYSVRGIVGVGKTQLAIEYAHTHAGDYDVVWWIAAEERASIPEQSKNIGRIDNVRARKSSSSRFSRGLGVAECSARIESRIRMRSGIKSTTGCVACRDGS